MMARYFPSISMSSSGRARPERRGPVWPLLGLLGLSACGSGFGAVSVYPRVVDEGAGSELLIYGHGFESGATASITWTDAAGNSQVEPITQLEVIDPYTIKVTLPDLTGRLSYPIFPYLEFITYYSEATPGLYSCETREPVVWKRGTSEGYCDALGRPLAYAAAGGRDPLIPPGTGDGTVLKYQTWYDLLYSCAQNLPPDTLLTEKQIALLIPDYGLGCFYPVTSAAASGVKESPATYAYCPAQIPLVEVNIVVSQGEKRSEISRGLSVYDYSHDYYYNEAYGNRVKGSFGAPLSVDVGMTPVAVAVDDLDGEGSLDLVVADQSTATLTVLAGPDFEPLSTSPEPLPVGEGPVALAIEDLNGDQRLDLVTANGAGKSVSTVFGLEGGGFSAGPELELADSPSALAVADLDGDLLPDLAVVSQEGDTIQIFLASAPGVFDATPSTVFDSGDGIRGPVSIALGDLDNQSGLDLVVSNAGDPDVAGDEKLSIVVNGGGGSFELRNTATTEEPGELATALVPGPNNHRVPRLMDLSGDGVIDIIAAHADDNPSRNSLLIFKGKLTSGSYSIESATDLPLSSSPQAVTLGDANGDALDGEALISARLDIITLNADGNATVVINNGSGSFSLLRDVSAGVGPVSAVSEDLDGDGDFDLAVADQQAHQVHILSNPSTLIEYFYDTLAGCGI